MSVTEFLNDTKNNGFRFVQVRGRKLAEYHGVAELRTKKNDYKAVAWDELGNATVLTKRGNVIQLIGNEYKGA